jgi:DNA-3-methyladenine glycosylase
MEFGPSPGRNFFERPCLEVARDLIGLILVRRASRGGILAGRIVEVEAYLGEGRDPASHAHRGPTPRNQSMFGPAGRLYVYRSYGIHLCVNLVCEPKGSGAAVLLRAVEPLTGMPQMRRNRGLADDCPLKLIAAGPGRLTQAFDIRHEHDGGGALRGAITLRRPAGELDVPEVVACPRVGISKAVEHPYRFCARGSAYLSRPPTRKGKRKRKPSRAGWQLAGATRKSE